jgi:hypothetical protein
MVYDAESGQMRLSTVELAELRKRATQHSYAINRVRTITDALEAEEERRETCPWRAKWFPPGLNERRHPALRFISKSLVVTDAACFAGVGQHVRGDILEVRQ